MSVPRTVVQSWEAPKPIGPYSVGIKAGQMVFVSGMAGIDPTSGKLVPGGIEAQTKQTLRNIANILEAADSSLGLVVKTTVFLKDMADFAKMNAVYAEAFRTEPPARSTVQAAALPMDALVEIEAVALERE